MTRWEYCVVDLDADQPAAYVLTFEGARPLYDESFADDSGESSVVIARLGDDGWELTTATSELVAESGVGSQPLLMRLRSNRLLYFKRAKQE